MTSLKNRERMYNNENESIRMDVTARHCVAHVYVMSSFRNAQHSAVFDAKLPPLILDAFVPLVSPRLVASIVVQGSRFRLVICFHY